MGRAPCCSKKQGLNRGAWTAVEDQILTDYINTHGQGKWGSIPKKADLNRCGKSCRLRWLNYLRPGIIRGNITDDEEELIIRLHNLLGNRWSLIAGRLPGRTDNEIKNYWNTIIGKKINYPPSPPPAPFRRSASFCAAHDQSMQNIPTIKRSYSFTAHPQAAADLHQVDHNKNYENATVPSEQSPALPEQEVNNANKVAEQFSPADDKTVPMPENFMMDLDIDKDFISDILNGTEFSQMKLEHHRRQQQYDLAGTDRVEWVINLEQ